MTRRIITGFTALALVLTACGGDDDGPTADESSQSDETTSDDGDSESTAAGVPDVSLLEGLPISEECQELYTKFIGAMGSVGTGSFDGMSEAFAGLADAVPDELRDDVAVLSEAFAELEQIVAENGGDLTAAMTDPEVQKAFEAIGSAEVTAASEALSAYFDETCPTT